MLDVLFYLLDGSEDFVHDLGDDGIAVGFEGFGAPLSERNGKAVHIKGKPIISSVNRGDRREVSPPSESGNVGIVSPRCSDAKPFTTSCANVPDVPLIPFDFMLSVYESAVHGVFRNGFGSMSRYAMSANLMLYDSPDGAIRRPWSQSLAPV